MWKVQWKRSPADKLRQNAEIYQIPSEVFKVVFVWHFPILNFPLWMEQNGRKMYDLAIIPRL